MSENPTTEPYDPAADPDADPEQLESDQPRPSQAEGEDEPTTTTG